MLRSSGENTSIFADKLAQKMPLVLFRGIAALVLFASR